MRRVRIGSAIAACIVVVAVLMAAVPADAAPPVGKRYAGVLIFVDPLTGELSVNRACLKFNRNGTFVTNEITNGVWDYVAGSNKRQMEAELLIDFDGMLVPAKGIGMIEKAGDGSSVGGTMVLDFGGVSMNVAFGGKQAKKRVCLAFVAAEDQD